MLQYNIHPAGCSEDYSLPLRPNNYKFMNETIAPNPENEAIRSYDFYESLFQDVNRQQPHKQGMTKEEFEKALSSPRTVKTEVINGTDRILIPQLCPVTQFEWLNDDFYEKKFPESFNRGNIMHFTDLKDVAPSNQVVDSIKELAYKGGVLVYDFPEIDPEAPWRIAQLLRKNGVEIEAAELLGTQTYYAGQTKLKSPHDPLPEPLGLIQAFDRHVRAGTYDPARYDNGASLRRIVDEDQARYMNQFYDEAFQVLNDHPCKQGLDPQEFFDMVANDADVAKIVNSKDGQTTALCIMGEDLSKFKWINPEFYESSFPDKFAKKQVVYFPALAARPDKVGSNTRAIVGLIAELGEVGDNAMLVAFDCCDMNKGFLDVMLKSLINRTPQASIDIRTIGTQYYGAIKLAQPKTVDL